MTQIKKSLCAANTCICLKCNNSRLTLQHVNDTSTTFPTIRYIIFKVRLQLCAPLFDKVFRANRIPMNMKIVSVLEKEQKESQAVQGVVVGSYSIIVADSHSVCHCVKEGKNWVWHDCFHR